MGQPVLIMKRFRIPDKDKTRSILLVICGLILFLAAASGIRGASAVFAPPVSLIFCALAIWREADSVRMYDDIYNTGEEYLAVLESVKTPLVISGKLNILLRSVPRVKAFISGRPVSLKVLGASGEPPCETGGELVVKYKPEYPNVVILTGKNPRSMYINFIAVWLGVLAVLSLLMLTLIIV
ncbi:MAG: hypothetical protein LBL09_01645 [Oscillospiraceae bacterium]|jgi:hypothetical protein|nr:hypothetical protein [Oscillospiraceae bacterium]